MKKFIIIFLVIMGGIFYFPKTAEAEDRTVIIDELLWSGSFISLADEFIVLKNLSTENIDLTGWQITKVDNQRVEEPMLTIPEGIIPSNGYFLISHSAKDHKFSKGDSILNIDPDLVSSDLTLSNSNLQIKIYDGQWDNGRLSLDTAGDGELPLAGNNETKSSMIREDESEDGTKIESWITNDDSINLDSGSLEFATPKNSGKPSILNITPNNKFFLAANPLPLTIIIKVSDPDGSSDIDKVYADLSSLSKITNQQLFDDGTNGDEKASDGIYTFVDYINKDIQPGIKNISFVVVDKKGLLLSTILSIEIYQLSDQIKINEIYPHPADGVNNEFIELYNSSDRDVNLFGWQLDDLENGGSKPYVLDQQTIRAKGYLSIYHSISKISLNDDGDEVRLISPDGLEQNKIIYPSAKAGFSYNKTDSGWSWSTTVTPNLENVITQIEANTINPDQTKNTVEQPLIQKYSISNAKQQKEGMELIVSGIVNVLPNTFSTQYFYIQDDESGIQIYCYDKDFPNLQIGDLIDVTGELSLTTSGARIKIKDQSQIKIISHEKAKITNFSTGNISEKYEGLLIKIKGSVTETAGNTFYIDDGTGAVKCYIKPSSKVAKPRMKKGMKVELIGVVVRSKNIWEVSPRYTSDIKIFSDLVSLASKVKKVMITSAKAAESTDTKIVQKGEVLGIREKATQLNNDFYHDKSLINLLENIIIISSVVLIFLLGIKYVGNNNQKSKGNN